MTTITANNPSSISLGCVAATGAEGNVTGSDFFV